MQPLQVRPFLLIFKILSFFCILAVLFCFVLFCFVFFLLLSFFLFSFLHKTTLFGFRVLDHSNRHMFAYSEPVIFYDLCVALKVIKKKKIIIIIIKINK